MAVCAVFGCNSSNDKKLKRNQVELGHERAKFFRFPKDKSLQKLWVARCARKDKFNVKNAFVCSKHFLPDHYARNLQHELLNYCPKNSKKLKLDAFPTENLPFSSGDREKTLERQERYRKRNRKQTVEQLLSLPDDKGKINLPIFDFNDEEITQKTNLDVPNTIDEFVTTSDKPVHKSTSTDDFIEELISQLYTYDNIY